MKQILTLFLIVAGLLASAQTTRPPGSVIGNVDTVSWNSTRQYKGSTFRLLSGGTVHVARIEQRLVGADTCLYAVSESGRFYAMNAAAERHSGGSYSYTHFNLSRPGDEVGANIYDAGRSLRMYQGLKLASFGSGIASVLALTLAAQNDSGPNTAIRTGTGAYVVAGVLAGTSLVFSLLADGQVHRAGRLLQIASGRINIGR